MTSSEANNPMNRIDIKIIPYRIIDLTDMPTTGVSLLIALAGGHSNGMYGPWFDKKSSCQLLEFFPRWKEQRSVDNILQTGRAEPLISLAFWRLFHTDNTMFYILLTLHHAIILPTCTHLGHQHRMAVTRGCIDTICLSWWWARCPRNM